MSQSIPSGFHLTPENIDYAVIRDMIAVCDSEQNVQKTPAKVEEVIRMFLPRRMANHVIQQKAAEISEYLIIAKGLGETEGERLRIAACDAMLTSVLSYLEQQSTTAQKPSTLQQAWRAVRRRITGMLRAITGTKTQRTTPTTGQSRRRRREETSPEASKRHEPERSPSPPPQLVTSPTHSPSPSRSPTPPPPPPLSPTERMQMQDMLTEHFVTPTESEISTAEALTPPPIPPQPTRSTIGGIANPSSTTCYMGSTMQALARSPLVRAVRPSNINTLLQNCFTQFQPYCSTLPQNLTNRLTEALNTPLTLTTSAHQDVFRDIQHLQSSATNIPRDTAFKNLLQAYCIKRFFELSDILEAGGSITTAHITLFRSAVLTLLCIGNPTFNPINFDQQDAEEFCRGFLSEVMGMNPFVLSRDFTPTTSSQPLPAQFRSAIEPATILPCNIGRLGSRENVSIAELLQLEYNAERDNGPPVPLQETIQVLPGSAPQMLPIALSRFATTYDRTTGTLRQFKLTTRITPSPELYIPYHGDSSRTATYRLRSIIVHAGATAQSGHYYTYMPQADGSWREYNDHRVINHPPPHGDQNDNAAQNGYLYFYEYVGDRQEPMAST